jgi:hypothetical protein
MLEELLRALSELTTFPAHWHETWIAAGFIWFAVMAIIEITKEVINGDVFPPPEDDDED